MAQMFDAAKQRTAGIAVWPLKYRRDLFLQRCWGWTRNLRRCGREGNWKLFCDDHRRQPVVAIFILVFTVVAGAASIYSAWFSKPANVAKSDYPFVRPPFYDPV